ncbi:MAG: hypothetical protein Q9211_004178 [Gyalolechia sp. 1 TL-2023]
MSYNSGYNYSPYYPIGGNNGRGQDSHQDLTSSNARYQSSSYGSNTNTSQNQQPPYVQQPQQSLDTPTTAAADRSAVSYSRYENNNSGSNQYQDLRGAHNFTDRSSAATTALGNLAHASSLEQEARNSARPRDTRSLQQIIDFNRSQTTHGSSISPLYGTNPPANYGHQQSDSRGTASPGVPFYRNPASTENRISTQSQYSQHGTSAGYGNPTVAYATMEEVRPNTDSYSPYQPNNQEQRQNLYHPQVSRPASGQSYRAGAPNTQIAQGVNQSLPVPANRVSTPISAAYVRPGTAQAPFRAEPTAPQQRQHADRRPSIPPAQSSGNRNTNPPSKNSPTVPTAQTSYTGATDSTSLRQTSTTRQEARTLVSSEEQVPTTVDPSHVFNHQEYQRRQAAAAAEVVARKAAEEDRLKKAAEAEESRKAVEVTPALKRVSESQNNATRDSEPSREEQMAAEMRQMIEKMRDYKSKDPSLFSSIWEQVKKTQPASSVLSAPPLSAKDIQSAPAQQSGQNGVNEIFSPSLVPNGDGELPDLGRFPAQRRRRGGKTDSPARKRKSAGKPANDSSPQVNGLQSGPPIDPAIIEASSHSQQRATSIPQQSSITPPAKAGPASQDRQVIYVSGVGPLATRPEDPQNPSEPAHTSAAPPASTDSGPSNQEAHPVKTPVQAPNPVGRTNWPENKKWDLAVAAKKILLSTPVNSAKAESISPEQILAYLNENPSYEQLCQLIESKGLIIERGHFARSLLDAVPGMGAGVHQQRQALASRSSASHSNTQHPNGISLATLAQPVNLGLLEGKQQTGSNQAPPAQMTPPSIQTPPASEEQPKVPLTKQEMARKRNIVDIVDLSQLSDDDMPPPPKAPRLDEYSAHPQSPAPGSEIDSLNGLPRIDTPNCVTGFPTFRHPPRHLQPYQPPYSYPLPPPPPPPPPPSALPSARQRELINSEDIVQPVDESKAMKRKRYDPKTIVKDVLIAAGRHPTENPLNYHLDILRKTFKYVNDVSDLDSFRWDLVDPGEPLAATLPGDSHSTRNTNLVDGTDGNEADDEDQDVSRSAHQSSTTAAPGFSTAVAASVPVPHVVGQPSKLLGPRRKRKRKQSDPDSNLNRSWTSSGQGGSVNHNMGESSPQTPQSALQGGSLPDTSGSTGIRRRGRPLGSKNRHPRKSSVTPGQSNGMPFHGRNDATPVRPSGLRNSIASTDGVAVVVPSPSPSIADKHPQNRPGRPKKSTPKSSQQSNPIHRIYKCQWKNCPAELHNLETLRKHVNKHSAKFRDEGSPVPCLWRGCGKEIRAQAESDDDEEPERQPLTFGTHDIWAKHMDRRHIAEFAWKLGDGPSIRSDSDMSDYVSDSAKRQVTPIIQNEGRPDPLPLSTSGKPHKVYHKAHGITTELGKAQAFMKATERRRQSFGPGIDRGGATFVTRRKNDLLDDSTGPLRKVQKDGEP